MKSIISCLHRLLIARTQRDHLQAQVSGTHFLLFTKTGQIPKTPIESHCEFYFLPLLELTY